MGDDFDPPALGINLNQSGRSCGPPALSVLYRCSNRLDGGEMLGEAGDNWRVDERRRHAETQIKGDGAAQRLRRSELESEEGVEREREAPDKERG